MSESEFVNGQTIGFVNVPGIYSADQIVEESH
jgi:hypothetical protein